MDGLFVRSHLLMIIPLSSEKTIVKIVGLNGIGFYMGYPVEENMDITVSISLHVYNKLKNRTGIFNIYRCQLYESLKIKSRYPNV